MEKFIVQRPTPDKLSATEANDYGTCSKPSDPCGINYGSETFVKKLRKECVGGGGEYRGKREGR